MASGRVPKTMRIFKRCAMGREYSQEHCADTINRLANRAAYFLFFAANCDPAGISVTDLLSTELL